MSTLFGRDFKSVELISSADTVTSKKTRKINEDINEFLDSMNTENTIRNEESKIETEILMESSMMNYQETMHQQNSKFKEALSRDFENETLVNTLAEQTFAYAVYEALPIDEAQKKHNGNYIYEQATGLFSSLKENLDFKQDILFNDMVSRIQAVVEGRDDSKDAKELFKESLELNSFELGIVTQMLKIKVTEAVRTEKELTVEKNRLIQEGQETIVEKYSKNKTLFRALQEKNTELALQEKGEDFDKSTLLDMVMAESLIDYTLLEAVYTMKLADIDFDNLQSTVRFM